MNFLRCIVMCLLAVLISGQAAAIDDDKDAYFDSLYNRYKEEVVNYERDDKIDKVVLELNRVITYLESNGRSARAIQVISRKVDNQDLLDNPLFKGEYIQMEARVKRLNGDATAALEKYIEAKELFEKEKDWSRLSHCLVLIGEHCRASSLHDKALEYLNEAEALYFDKGLTDTMNLLHIYNRLAAVHNEYSGDTSLTLGFTRKALDLAIKTGNKNAQAISYNEMGFTYKNLMLFKKANACYRKAEALWRSVGAKISIANVMNNRAMSYQSENFYSDSALTLYHQLIDYVAKEELVYSLARPYQYLFELALLQKDTGRAFGHFVKYNDEVYKERDRQHTLSMRNLSEKYESEKAKNELIKVNKDLDQAKEKVKEEEQANQRKAIYIIVLAVLVIAVLLLMLFLRRSNIKLNNRNKEKDALIQEIHHRVKNNLQFISSIMNMQMNVSENDRELDSLSDASRRIKAMALVHEMLYNQGNTEGIQIKRYLEELTSTLRELVDVDDKPIDFTMDVDDLQFDVSTSIALGMISSEFIANSIKHAFNDIDKPKILVSLKKDVKGNNHLFMLEDNGPGFEQAESSSSLGLRLIDIFSRQLKGDYELNTKSGCKFEINFKVK